jgi:predicted lipoprotein with Yx(FWY)xxD motif
VVPISSSIHRHPCGELAATLLVAALGACGAAPADGGSPDGQRAAPSDARPAPAPDAAAPHAEPSVELTYSDPFGIHLADGRGLTLYYFAKDRPAPGGAAISSCAGACAAVFPPFHTETIGNNLHLGDFAEITRADGRKQTTYRGWPLYYYADEAGAGTLSGDGINHVWFAIPWPDYSLLIMNGLQGDLVRIYLADPSGRTLYYLAADTLGGIDPPRTSCTGACEATWPPYFAANNVSLPSSLDLSEYGLMMRPDGTWQSTWAGHPLYYFHGDLAPGDLRGDGADNAGFLVQPRVK